MAAAAVLARHETWFHVTLQQALVLALVRPANFSFNLKRVQFWVKGLLNCLFNPPLSISHRFLAVRGGNFQPLPILP